LLEKYGQHTCIDGGQRTETVLICGIGDFAPRPEGSWISLIILCPEARELSGMLSNNGSVKQRICAIEEILKRTGQILSEMEEPHLKQS
jgi:hypothetical protein